MSSLRKTPTYLSSRLLDSFISHVLTLISSWQALGQTFSLSLACVECRTWGTLVASAEFPEDLGDLINDLSDLNPLNDASLSVGFQGVGALVDLKLTTGGEGQFALPLFITETPLGISVSCYEAEMSCSTRSANERG